jgi:hypothetical protein
VRGTSANGLGSATAAACQSFAALLTHVSPRAAFDVLSLLWKNVGGSPCYPAVLAAILSRSRGWIAILLVIVALVLLILLVATYVTKEAERICRLRLLALAFATVLATFPIMLGWAVKDMYLLYIVNDDVPFLSFIIIFVVVRKAATSASAEAHTAYPRGPGRRSGRETPATGRRRAALAALRFNSQPPPYAATD